MHRALLLAGLGVAVLAPPGLSGELTSLQVSGYLWEGGPHPSARPLNGAGQVESVDPPRLWNRGGFVLTWHLRELTPGQVTRVGGTTSIEYSGGRLTIHADNPASVHHYGTDPPNASVPADFTDGFGIYLDGSFRRFVLTYDESGRGTIEGNFTFQAGFALSLLAGQLDWRFEATVSRDAPGGYAFGLQGGFSPESDPTTVGERSWGGIKAIYR